MARPLRLEDSGAIYHVMNRGDRRQTIVRSEQDRVLFLETLAAVCAKAGWQTHAYCLMSNHFHLVIEIPRANLVSGMKWLLGTYTMRFNRRHRFSGHLFGGRYKAQVIDESEPLYLRMAADYVHLNPARAGLVEGKKPLESYAWSSYPVYLLPPRRRPSWLRVDRLLGEHGIVSDNARGRREFSRRMEGERSLDQTATLAQFRGGWLVGAEDFVTRLLERVEGRVKEHHGGRERAETELEKARRIISRELAAAAWDAKRLRVEAKVIPLRYGSHGSHGRGLQCP
jgi:putative transposase